MFAFGSFSGHGPICPAALTPFDCVSLTPPFLVLRWHLLLLVVCVLYCTYTIFPFLSLFARDHFRNISPGEKFSLFSPALLLAEGRKEGKQPQDSSGWPRVLRPPSSSASCRMRRGATHTSLYCFLTEGRKREREEREGGGKMMGDGGERRRKRGIYRIRCCGGDFREKEGGRDRNNNLFVRALEKN